MKNRLLGAHVSASKGSAGIIQQAGVLQANAVQIFSGNPRGWTQKAFDVNADTEIAKQLQLANLALVIHSPYLINLASAEEHIYNPSINTMKHSIKRTEALGALSVVVHAGRTKDRPRQEGLNLLAERLLALVEEFTEVKIAVELTSGGKGAVVTNLEQAKELLNLVDNHERIGICLDTCHFWAAGNDWSKNEVLIRSEIKDLGNDKIFVVHLNDSRDLCGSERDRHANIGKGNIGLESLLDLCAWTEFSKVPFILETPEASQQEDMAILRDIFF